MIMKYLYIFLTIITVNLASGSIHAATRCLDIKSSSTCNTMNKNGMDWLLNCGGITIMGTALCLPSSHDYSTGASQNYYNMVSSATTIDDLKHCWCMRTVPSVSKAVFITSYSSTADCFQNCTTNCTNTGSTNSTVRTALLTF